MSRHFNHKLLLPGIFLLTGCTSPAVAPVKYPEQRKMAEAFIQKGQPKKAAKLYQQLADSPSELQNQFRLLAIESLIQAGDSQTAKSYADAIDPASLSPHQRNQLNLYYAQIDLSFGEAEQSLNRLDLVQPYLLNRTDLIKYHQSRAFGYSLAGELLKSAASRIELGQLLSPSQQQENNSAILEALSLIPLSELEQNLNQSSGILSGWIALARVLKLKEQGHAPTHATIRDWQLAYPRHPANSEFLSNYLKKPNNAFKQPGAIAVFLPESGPYARAGKAIREGILAAYYQDLSSSKPGIRFYDSENTALPTLYHQAIVEGAELIIGPLSKTDIQTLAESADFNIPVLALNHVSEITKANLYQFGLSPIDDTEQITSKAWFDGHQKALILIPDSEQGARIGGYLKEYWERTSGAVLETQTYDPNQTDFSNTIKKLLNLDESNQRYQHIRRLIPSAKYVPRRRQDADVIFLNAYETAARSINPQLKFYHASRIPVYATPHVYSGLPNPSMDFDLDNITFCDTPWLIDNAYQGELSLQALRDTWRQFPSIYLRLMAMGIDAYKVVAHLDKLDTLQYHGATGNLLLTDNNRIKRNLVCAKFVRGLPNIIGFINSTASGYESIAVTPEQTRPSDNRSNPGAPVAE
ncbi:MAG: penicillin-binding protein activator [Gammaproteobacteria bacterium]